MGNNARCGTQNTSDQQHSQTMEGALQICKKREAYTDRVVEEGRYELIVGGALAVHVLHSLRSFFQAPCQLAILVFVPLPLQQHCMSQRHQHCLLRQPYSQFALHQLAGIGDCGSLESFLTDAVWRLV